MTAKGAEMKKILVILTLVLGFPTTISGQILTATHAVEEEKSVCATALTVEDALNILEGMKAGCYLFNEEYLNTLIDFFKNIDIFGSDFGCDLGTLEEVIKYFPNIAYLNENIAYLNENEARFYKTVREDFDRWVKNLVKDIDIEPITCTILKIKKGDKSYTFSHDEFGQSYFQEAERGEFCISILGTVSSTIKNPNVPYFQLYRISNVEPVMTYLGNMSRRYYRVDFSDYWGNTIGHYNDFRYTETVKFVWYARVETISEGYYIVVLPKDNGEKSVTLTSTRSSCLLELMNNYFLVAKY